MLHGQNVIVLDLETLHSSLDCIHCSIPKEEWDMGPCVDEHGHQEIGWNNKPALGLSIGAYHCGHDSRTYFFDVHNLATLVGFWVSTQPLIVTFNGTTFDLPLLRGILRRRAETLPAEEGATLSALCDAFKLLCGQGYDILQEIWIVSPESKRVRGLNGLGSLAAANGLGGKTGDGAQAPRDWAEGRYATVANYCSHDVWLTTQLFEKVLRGQPLLRSDGSRLTLPLPLPSWGVTYPITMDPMPTQELTP